MSRRKLKTTRQRLLEENVFKIQKFEQPIGEPKRFIRQTHYMMSHKNYKALSSSAKVLLAYMLDWAFANEEFAKTHCFPYSTTMPVRDGIMSNKTAIKSMQELDEAGFIQKENNASALTGVTQKWSFSDRWYTGERRHF